jgi:nitroreductase
MDKRARTKYRIAEIIADRWSPRAFLEKNIEKTKLTQLFEAAQWAPSAFNEQPWRFIAAKKDDKENYAKMLSCLAEANQQWAGRAPLLLLLVVSKNSSYNNEPNRWAMHDCGLALENLLLEAVDLGLAAHPMAGFSVDAARKAFNIPEDFEPLVAVAVGYKADADTLDGVLKERELDERDRRPLDKTFFAGNWGNPFK